MSVNISVISLFWNISETLFEKLDFYFQKSIIASIFDNYLYYAEKKSF